MITYNQERFIGQAIESVLMQKTDFSVELVIGEDCSTDSTAEIVKGYATKYPDNIVVRYNTSNIGMMPNVIKTLQECRGKYIAMLEGDDYWTDPNKLQEQVDFLELNPGFVFCFHDALILKQKTGETKVRIGEDIIDEVVDLKSVIVQKNIPTASLVFRNRVINFEDLPGWYSKTLQGDYGLVILLAEKGLGKFLRNVMSVYRIHDGGVWSGNSNDNCYLADDDFYKCLLVYFSSKKEVLRVIKMKMHFLRFNWGVNLIRRGYYGKGLLKIVANFRYVGDQRLSMSLLKLPSAVKESFLNHGIVK